MKPTRLSSVNLMRHSIPDSVARGAELLQAARRILVLTGAGVSAESGVPTFREAQTGLWSRYDAATLASPQGFAADPGLVWRWYMERLRGVEDALPNAGHSALAALERARPETVRLYTQNVDDLHERAGSREVRHLHGRIHRFRCAQCHREHALAAGDREALEPPRCPGCGGRIRPDVVWFGEMLPEGMLEAAEAEAQACDLMLVVGTSGLVFPAAALPQLARRAGATLIDVNPEPTPISHAADLYLQGPGGVVLPQLLLVLGGATERG